MKPRLIVEFKKINEILPKILILLSMLLIVSCAASLHRGQVTVPKPSLNETTEAIWFNYWQDQFDGFAGNVIAPAVDFPDAAKQGYQRAALQWQDKVTNAKAGSELAGYVGGLVISLILLAVLL